VGANLPGAKLRDVNLVGINLYDWILRAKQNEPAMFAFFRRFPWLLPVHEYGGIDDLLLPVDEKVIAPADAQTEMRFR
jgi:hypothetical protein